MRIVKIIIIKPKYKNTLHQHNNISIIYYDLPLNGLFSTPTPLSATILTVVFSFHQPIEGFSSPKSKIHTDFVLIFSVFSLFLLALRQRSVEVRGRGDSGRRGKRKGGRKGKKEVSWSSLFDEMRDEKGEGGKGTVQEGRQYTANRQPPTTNHQPPTTNHQPPTTNHQPPTTNHQPPTTNHQPPIPITNHQSPITNHQSPITNHQSPITNHQSPITNHQSPITNHQSPITNHQSPITNHQSPITNHQSPITNHQSPIPTFTYLYLGSFFFFLINWNDTLC